MAALGFIIKKVIVMRFSVLLLLTALAMQAHAQTPPVVGSTAMPALVSGPQRDLQRRTLQRAPFRGNADIKTPLTPVEAKAHEIEATISAAMAPGVVTGLTPAEDAAARRLTMGIYSVLVAAEQQHEAGNTAATARGLQLAQNLTTDLQNYMTAGKAK